MAKTEKRMHAKITADDRDFKKKTEGAKKQGKSFGETMVGVAKLVAGAFILKKAYDGISRLIGGLMEMSDRLLDLSDITGMNTDQLQEWQYVAKIAGVNSEAVASAAQNLTNRFQNLYREQSPISRGFRELGVEAFDAGGNLRNTGEIVDEVITTLADMENITERNAYGAQLFGGSWKDLAPILSMGAEGIEQLKQEARDLGVVMDKEAIEKANELRQSQVRLKEVSGALGREIASALTPVLTTLAEVALDGTKWLRRLADTSTAFRDPVKKAKDETEEFIDSLEGLNEEARKERVSEYLADLRKRQSELAASSQEASSEYQELSGRLSHNSITLLNAAKNADALEEAYDSVSIQIKNLLENTNDFISTGEDSIKVFNAQTATINELSEEIKNLQEQKKTLSAADKDELDNINQKIERYTTYLETLSDYRHEIKEVTQATNDLLGPSKEFAHIIEQTDEQILEQLGNLELVTEEYERMPAAIMRVVDHLKLAQDAAFHFGETIKWAAVTGQQGLKDYGKTVANVARENIKAYMAEAIAAAIKSRIGIPGVGIAMAGLAAGAAAALFNTLVPAFAQGGAVSGPTLALVGEGAGVSRSNPEFIGTAKQMGQMGMGGGKVRFEIEGDKLVGIMRGHNDKGIYFG